MNILEKCFKLKARGTNVRTEIMAGITTFMTMAYILAVNPQILSATGMDPGAVFMGTCIASFIATLVMALVANYPFVLAPGMGLNAFFTYTVVIGMGYSWQMALAAVFIEGIIFIILSVLKVREAIFDSIPLNLKYAVSAGIGLFIAFIGFQNCGLVVDDPATLLSIFSFSDSIAMGTMPTAGISALLALIGILITGMLMIKKVKGGILFGILITWVIGMICQLAGLYVPDYESYFSLFPDLANYSIPSIEPVFMKMDFSSVLSFNFLVIILSFLFVDIFDTLGGLIGISSQAGFLDKNGKLPGIRGALLSDAIGTTAGAMLGTSTVTTYIESATGVSEGGRTGLTALTSGLLFVAAIFLSPIFLAIPGFATAPALVIVGFMMMSTVIKVNFKDYTQGIPAFITIIAMPFFYSIAEGIALGIISFTILDIFDRVANKNKPHTKISKNILMYVLAVLMVLKYIFL